jgi:hypothetical protein
MTLPIRLIYLVINLVQIPVGVLRDITHRRSA